MWSSAASGGVGTEDPTAKRSVNEHVVSGLIHGARVREVTQANHRRGCEDVRAERCSLTALRSTY